MGSWPPDTHESHNFQELDAAECIELLAGSPIARVAWCGTSGPQIVPVTIVLQHEAVVFRTAPYTALARAVPGATLAVAADNIDPAARTGWSVMAIGSAEVVWEPGELTELWHGGGPEPWAPGVRSLFVRVVLTEITGRRIAHR